ncbi:MAG: phosphatase PAP2 family protein [Chloroflexi bacterium]|nr:phosphatase PAP2 family protein [Chloroflexota bacterium]
MAAWLQTLNDASVPFLVWIQGWRSGGLDVLMSMMSWLGREYFYLLLFPFLYWCISKRWGTLAGLGLVGSLYVGEYIKWVFKLPRPPSPPVVRLWAESSPGFVSTHAAPAVGVWGTLAWLVRKRWFTALAITIAFLIGWSRLYLGVHYPADVVGGWLVGLVVMVVVVKWLPPAGARIKAWPLRLQVGAVFILALFLLLIFPSNWEGQRPAESGVLNTGVLAGFLWGLIWDARKLHFKVGGSWRQRLTRFVVGLVLVLAAYIGLNLLFEPLSQGSYTLAQSLRFVRYAAVGFVIPGLGPWVFQRLHLSGEED